MCTPYDAKDAWIKQNRSELEVKIAIGKIRKWRSDEELSETAAHEKRTHRRQKKITPTRVREIGGVEESKGGREKGAHVGVDNAESRVLQG